MSGAPDLIEFHHENRKGRKAGVDRNDEGGEGGFLHRYLHSRAAWTLVNEATGRGQKPLPVLPFWHRDLGIHGAAPRIRKRSAICSRSAIEHNS